MGKISNDLAVVFTRGSPADDSVEEGLEMLTSLSILGDRIGLFLISDGLFLLRRSDSSPEGERFVSALSALSLWGECPIYLCADSALERGLGEADIAPTVGVNFLTAASWRDRLERFGVVLVF